MRFRHAYPVRDFMETGHHGQAIRSVLFKYILVNKDNLRSANHSYEAIREAEVVIITERVLLEILDFGSPGIGVVSAVGCHVSY